MHLRRSFIATALALADLPIVIERCKEPELAGDPMSDAGMPPGKPERPVFLVDDRSIEWRARSCFQKPLPRECRRHRVDTRGIVLCMYRCGCRLKDDKDER